MQGLAKESVIIQFCLLLAAVALFTTTYTQSFSATEVAQSPMFFPRIILSLWIGLNLVALFQTARSDQSVTPIASWSRIGIVILATLIYTNVIGSEGFFLPSVVFALVCLPAFGIQNPILVVLFAIAVPGSLVLLFNHLLGMPLPTSRFTYFF